jgi:hypothetical protein
MKGPVMSTDPGTLIRELRPADDAFDADSPAARAALERILAAPPLPPARRPRRAGRRLVLATAVALVAVAAVGLAPFLRSTPDVVARAAAALGEEGTILHFTAEIRARESAAEVKAGRPDDRVDDVVESWQGEGRARSVLRGGHHEIVLDTTTGRGEEFIGEFDAIAPIDLRDAGSEDEEPGLGAGALPSGVVGDLTRLLERARDGEENVRLVGETTVRGIAAYELRLDYTFTPTAGGNTRPQHMSRVVYVDRERFLPLRVIERGPHGETFTVTDYTSVERLPVTPATRAELRMRPHPGAARPDANGTIRMRPTVPRSR